MIDFSKGYTLAHYKVCNVGLEEHYPFTLC